jgi:hypothetical protein
MVLAESTERRIAALVLGGLLLTACKETIPPEALKLTAQSLEQRQAQTRRFDTSDEAKILSASAAVIQDLGFTVEESASQLGLIVAAKDRDATEAGQVAAAVVMAVLLGVAMPIDKQQKIRVSLVTRPHGEQQQNIAVRITFQRVVWDTQGKISKVEALTDAKLYQEFFEKLSKAVFLEAHAI